MALTPFANRIAQTASILSILSGAITLLGWYADLPALRSVAPHFAPMAPNAGLCFIVIGVALWLVNTPRAFYARGLGGLIIVIAGATLSQSVFAVDLGIDRLLLPAAHPRHAEIERMSSATALSLLLIGIVLARGLDRPSRLNRLLMLIPAILAGIALLGFLYNARSLYALLLYEGISFNATLTLIAVSLSYFYSQPSPFITILVSDTTAGLTGRRLIPLAILAPVLLGWLVIAMERANYFDEVVGTALLVLLTASVFALVVALTMRVQYTADRSRAEAAANALELAMQRQREQLLKEFTTSTLHDLRTPITSIGTSAYIASRLEDPVKRSQRLAHIQDQVQYMGKLLDQFAEMVSLNQMERIRLSSVPLNELVTRVVNDHLASGAQQDVKISSELPPDEPRVAASEMLLRTAIAHTLGNAIQFTPRGGAVKVRVEVSDGFARIIITDTGVGIPADALARVFEPQYKVNEARTTDGSSGGFGLAMVKRILELHHGKVEIDSAIGKGTTARLIIPLYVTLHSG